MNPGEVQAQTMRPQRSAMFFEADLLAAADGAAFAMECHGLTPEEATALGEHLSNGIREFFDEVAR